MKQKIIEKHYLAFSSENHAEGSNTAPSYVAALKKIDTALHQHGVFLAPSESVWEIRDVERWQCNEFSVKLRMPEACKFA